LRVVPELERKGLQLLSKKRHLCRNPIDMQSGES
jgi:hypothetical protein